MFYKTFIVLSILCVLFILLFTIILNFSTNKGKDLHEHLSDNSLRVGDISDNCNVLLSNNFYHASDKEVPQCRYVTPLVTKENTNGVNGILFADTTNQTPKRHSGWGIGKSLDWLIQSVKPQGSVYIQPNGGQVLIGKSEKNNVNNQDSDSYNTKISGGLYVGGNSNIDNALHVDGNVHMKNANVDDNMIVNKDLQTNNLNVKKNSYIGGNATISGSVYANGFDLTNQRIVKGDLQLHGGKIIFKNPNSSDEKVTIEKQENGNDNNNLAIHLGKSDNSAVGIYKNNSSATHSFRKDGAAYHAGSLCIGNTCLSVDEIRRLKEKINSPCVVNVIKTNNCKRRRRRRFWR